MAKDAGLRIRVERDLRKRFLDACREQDAPGAQVLRAFMREYVATHDLADAAPSHLESQRSGSAGPGRKSNL